MKTVLLTICFFVIIGVSAILLAPSHPPVKTPAHVTNSPQPQLVVVDGDCHPTLGCEYIYEPAP